MGLPLAWSSSSFEIGAQLLPGHCLQQKATEIGAEQKNQNTKEPQESNWMVLQTCNVMFVPLQTFANLSTARIETETKQETPFVLKGKFKHWNFLIGGLKIQRPHVVSSESVGFAFIIRSSSRTLWPRRWCPPVLPWLSSRSGKSKIHSRSD